MATKPGKSSASPTAISDSVAGSPSADVIQAQINDSLAASRKLVALWLPKPGPGSQINAVPEVPLQPTVGRLGVGATATTGQKLIARGPLSGLLSKRRPTGEATSSKRSSDSRGGQDDDSDDEEDRGRSSLADKAKKRKTGPTIVAKPHAKPATTATASKKKKKKADA